MANVFWTAAANGDWTTAADWSTGTVPLATDDAVLAITGFSVVEYYTVSITTAINIDAVLITDTGAALSLSGASSSLVTNSISDAGDIELQYGGTMNVTGDVTTLTTSNSNGNATGTINVDTQTDYGNNFAGGSQLTIDGTLTNGGALNIGGTFLFGGGITATSTVSAAQLVNTGSISLLGNPDTGTSKQAQLIIAAAAPTTWMGSISLSNEALLEYGSGSIRTIAQGAEIYLASSDGYIADASDPNSNSALIGLDNNAGNFQLQYGAQVALSGDLVNTITGSIDLDTQTDYGNNFSGGSKLTINGTLTNSGSLALGGTFFFGGGITATSTVTADALINTGTINLLGNPSAGTDKQAQLIIGSAAPTTWQGILTLGSQALLEYATGSIETIAQGAEILISSANAHIADASDTSSNSALTGLTSNAGNFQLQDGVTLVNLDGDFTNTGETDIDNNTDYGLDANGGSTLTVQGTFFNSGTLNTNNGLLSIGNGILGGQSTVNAGAFDNTGIIRLAGSANFQAELNIAGPAGFGTAGLLTGAVYLGFNGASNSLLKFTSGEINKIDASGLLDIYSATAFLADASNVTSNSALTGLDNNAGVFNIEENVTVQPGGDFANSGTVNIDNTGYGEGGSKLLISGTLNNIGTLYTNNGTLNIGNSGLSASDEVSASTINNTGIIRLAGSTTAQALLNISGAGGFGTAGVLTGTVILGNNGTTNSLIEFASGQINSIASGADLDLHTSTSFVADASDTASNSALVGLTENDGTFSIEDHVTVAPDGDFTNTGTTSVDGPYGTGGSILSITGTFNNVGTLYTSNGQLNIGNSGMSTSDEVSAAALNNTGTIRLAGTTAAQALLDISGAAGFGTAGIVTGTVVLGNNGTTNSLVEFGSGQITSIASGADLDLHTSTSFVADASDTASNSALVGLTENDGTFNIEDHVTVAPGGDFTNTGTASVDGPYGTGGSSLTIAGTLNNVGTLYTSNGQLNIGNSGLSTSDEVSAAGLNNTGTIRLAGTAAAQAWLNIGGIAGFGSAGVVTGAVVLGNNGTTNSLIEFTSGQINSIASGADLDINTATSFVADATDTASNSALVGLNSNAGTFNIENNVTVTPSGDFDNSGTLDVDASAGGESGSKLLIGGTLTNSYRINVGNNNQAAGDTLSTAAFTNVANAQLTVTGSSNGVANFNVSGSVSNAGYITLNPDVTSQIGSLDNSGTLNIYGSNANSTSLSVLGTATNSNSIYVGAYAELGVTGAFSDTGSLTVAGTLDLANPLTLSASGSLVMQGGTVIDPNNGAIIIQPGTTMSGYGTVDVPVSNDGTITASGGLLDLAGAVTGNGQFQVASGAELEFGGAITDGSFSYNGNVGTLKLDNPAGFSDAISGLVAGDAIDLVGVQATSATLNGSTLTIVAGTQSYSYQVSGPGLTGNTFSLENDQQGGTDVVLGPPGPTISGPKTQTAFLGYPSLLGPLTIADPNAGNGLLTVTVTAGTGALSGVDLNGDPLSGSGTNKLTITGDLTDINTILGSVLYSGATAGTTDNVQVVVSDASNATAAQNIAVTTDTVPYTQAVLNLPANGDDIIAGVPTALGGISVNDPYSQANNLTDSLTILTDNGQLSANSSDGGTVIGQNAQAITITGTPDQLNAYSSDDIVEYSGLNIETDEIVAALQNYRFGVDSAGFNARNAFYALQKGQSVAQNAKTVLDYLRLVKDTGVLGEELAGELNAVKALDDVDILILRYGTGGGPEAHIMTTNGYLYQLDLAGEFIYGVATLPGDSYQVQIRLQPTDGSASASEITEVAASVGTDTVTFAVGRSSTVWVDGAAVTINPATPSKLAGGSVSETGISTYLVTWNTGETLTIVNHGSYLDINSSTPNPDEIAGLSANNPFTTSDGTTLQQPITIDQLYNTFANSWRVTTSTSLFDYGPGQSTTTFTDLSFPYDSITLADLPVSVVTLATQAVLNAGITNAAEATATEYDYIASGGNPGVIANDKNLYQNVSPGLASVSESQAPPIVLGVFAPLSAVRQVQGGVTDVTFDVYLTAPESTDTEVDYQVVAPEATDFDAADFGGALPTGSVTILAGQTTGTITIEVPDGALGALPSKNVALQISTPSSVAIFAPSSVEEISASAVTVPAGAGGSGGGGATGSTVASPVLEYLGTVGAFTQSGNDYTLNLGDIQFGEMIPNLQFGIANDAASPGDSLTGTFTWPTVAGFNPSIDGQTVSGSSLLSAIAAGSADDGLTITTVQDKFGAQSEVITFTPVDTNTSGYSQALAPITLTITDTLEVPGMIYSQAEGDVHIETYNGLLYDFQSAGQFTLAKSNITGDSFDIELRLQPYTTSTAVTTIQQVAASVGTDRITFGITSDGRAATVLVDGAVTTLSMADPTLTLNGGSVTEVSPSVYQVNWSTGESMTVTQASSPVLGYSFFNVSDAVPYASYGEISGLQGWNEGQQNDFQLPDGTVLQQPLTSAELYGEYADAWRVSQANNLFDYVPGQSYQTFAHPNYPATTPITLADLPANVVAAAAQVVAAAGITDPALAAAAELDYIATGDPSFLTAAANVNQQVSGLTAADVTPSTPPAAEIGVEAAAMDVTEAANGVTPVTFTAYLTGTETSDTTINYTATLGTTALVSSSVVIAAGATTAQIVIDVPQNALGLLPDAPLQVVVSSPGNAVAIFAPTAQTEIVNPQPEPGAPASAVLAYLGNVGSFTFNAATNTYTLNLGSITQGASEVAAEFGVVNAATGAADNLGGTFSYPTGEGFTVTGNNLPSALAPGAAYEGLYSQINTADLGTNTMTLTFNPVDENDSGYSQALAPITLDIVDSIVPPAVPQLNTPTTIIFPNVHVGTIDSQHVSVTNTAASGAQNLDVSLSASGNATASGTISQLAPGTTDASDLTVGIDTSTAGALSGAVTETFTSDSGSGQTSPIAEESPYIDLFGTAYRLADPSVLPSDLTVHEGDSGSQTITLTNLDPNDGYSENLIATVSGTTGAVTASGTTGDIDPQSAGSIAVSFSTATPGAVGSVTLHLQSDGTGIDGLGMTDLGYVTIPINVTSASENVPAAAQFEDVSGVGTLTNNGTAYTLNLGTISAPTTVSLGVLNSANVPADDLSGTFDTSGATSQFVNSGFTAFSNIAAGSADTGLSVTLNTSITGTFTETITLNPIDMTTQAALAAETLTITGTIATATVPVITAPASVALDQGVTTAVSGISIADANVTSDAVTLTATLSDANGLLSVTPSGTETITGSGTTALTITGTLGEVNADLATLTDTDSSLAADSISIDASDSSFGVATPATTTISVSAPLTITAPASALVQQGIAGAISGIRVTDNNATSDAVTLTATLSDTHGLLSVTGSGTITGAGTTALTIVGTLAQVNADLATLTDTDSSLAADSILINASDSLNGVATQQTTSIAVNAAPAITAPASALIQQSVAGAITGISIADSDAVGANETVTATLSDTHGLLSVTGSGTITGAGTTALTIVGTLAQVNADLATLTDTDSSLAADSLVINASDNRGGVALQQTTSIAVNAVPVITAPASALIQQSVAAAIAGISIADSDAVGANETVTATLSDTHGLLSVTGSGTITGAGTTALTIVGTLAQVNADLATLTDTDSTLATDSLVINASDNRGGVALQQTTSIAVNAAPAITAPASALIQQSVAAAIAGISIADSDAVGANETVTATLSDTNGLLSVTGSGTITGAGTTALTIVGTLAQVNADLATLSDTDSSLTADSLVINASDSRGGIATQQTTSIAVNAAPAITAPASALIQQSVAGAIAGLSIADSDAVGANETVTATLSDTHGLLSVTGSGTITGAGTTALTIVGTLAQVNADLATLTDTDSTLATDSLVINASDNRGGVALQQTTSIAVNAVPVITAPASALIQQSVAGAIAGLSIADSDAVGANETVTATLSDTNGLLSVTGSGTITGAGTTALTIVGTLAQVNADLATLTDTDSTLATDSLVINASDNRGGIATQQTTSIAVNAVPLITAPSSAEMLLNQASAVSGVSLADPDGLSGETYTAVLSDTDGLLAVSGTAGTITGSGTTTLTISGTLAQINTDLATLKDTESSLVTDRIAITASDNLGGVATPAAIALSVNTVPPSVSFNPIDGSDTINSASYYTPPMGPYQIYASQVTVAGGNPQAIAFSGSVTNLESGSSFGVSVATSSFEETYVATVGANDSWSASMPASDVAQLPNGTATVTAALSDGTVLGTQPISIENSAPPKSLTISNDALLEIFGASSANTTFASTTAGTLELDKSAQYTGTIAGFGGQDAIDLSDIAFGAQTTLGYTANPSGMGGTLSLSDGTHTANLALFANYMASSFVKSSDGHGGTLITDGPLTAQNDMLTQLHHT